MDLFHINQNNIDENTRLITELAEQVQIIENTYLGDLDGTVSGDTKTFDATTVSGDKGPFT